MVYNINQFVFSYLLYYLNYSDSELITENTECKVHLGHDANSLLIALWGIYSLTETACYWFVGGKWYCREETHINRRRTCRAGAAFGTTSPKL